MIVPELRLGNYDMRPFWRPNSQPQYQLLDTIDGFPLPASSTGPYGLTVTRRMRNYRASP